MNKLRILILDDEIIIARDIERIIKQLGEVEVMMTNSSEEILAVYKEFKPHLLLCDMNLEETYFDGVKVCEIILKELKTQVVFITAHSDDAYLERAKALKPLGYIIKPFDEKQIVAMVTMALSRDDTSNGGSLKQNFEALFTETEFTIVKLIAHRKTTSEIADQLYISPKTVENHRYNISHKLDLKAQNNSLLSWAIENKANL